MSAVQKDETGPLLAAEKHEAGAGKPPGWREKSTRQAQKKHNYFAYLEPKIEN